MPGIAEWFSLGISLVRQKTLPVGFMRNGSTRKANTPTTVYDLGFNGVSRHFGKTLRFPRVPGRLDVKDRWI